MLTMTAGPATGVGDSVSGQPVAQSAQSVARGGYQGGTPGVDQGGEPSFDIGGQQVPLSELQRGYMRQSDYTQKTQSLATQRQQYEAASRLVEALQADPRSTLLQLAEAAGVDPATLLDPGDQGYGDGGYGQDGGQYGADQGLDPNDPVHQELMSLRQQVQELSQGYDGIEDAQANSWLDQETAKAAQLFEQAGLDFEPEELYQYAAEREIADVDAAAKALAFEKMLGAVQGQQPQLPEELAGLLGDEGQAPSGSFPSQGPAMAPVQRQQAAAFTPRAPLTSAPQPVQNRQAESLTEALGQTLQELGISDLRQIDMGT